MPKSNPNHDPAKGPSDDQARVNDIALRKKKNADAQAAFRARRTNYIATLEETVTNLESVVLQLQESCRDARSEASDWKQECARTRLELREREKYWRCFWQSRKSSHTNGDDPLPLPPPVNAAALLPPPGNIDTQVGHGHPQQLHYSDENASYRGADSCPAPPTYPGSDHSSYTTSPSIPMVSWPVQHHPPGNTMESHQTEVSYSSRPFGGAPEEQKLQLHAVLDNAPYTFSNDDRYRVSGSSVPESRSLSPSSSTTASTTATLAPVYPFTFPEPSARFTDRGEIDVRRHSLSHSGEVTLHGGTADLSTLSLGGSEALGFRFGVRKSGSGPDSEHPRTTPIPSIPNSSGGFGEKMSGLGCGASSSGGGHLDRLSSDSDSNGVPLSSRSRRKRGMQHTSSRPPSPGPPSLSCTVAVIKAQAFGALRRTRVRGKKSSEGAARVAMDVLEARGIGIGGPTSSKRARLDNEEFAMET